ncbi:hypothetical protein PoB_003671700 [Plakobranchus ocellatus]|uniref:Uncharacterized protein n=1 Tax=Plakobranchus ocellatus TaxID=259542 RepID=A0AAV4ATB9_9GAST|nr:hypothetical protein PoB_003671700 [Plakobranchus ocellatus]
MSCLSNFQSSSIYQKIAFFLLLIALCLAWISFVTTGWGDAYITDGSPDTLTGYGLWRRCGDTDFAPNCEKLTGWNLDWYRAVQAFAIIGFVCVNVSLLLIILLVFLPKCHQSKAITLWIVVLSFLSAFSYILAVIIFAVGFDSTFEVTGSDDASVQYGWGLALCVFVLDIVAGALFIVEARHIGAKAMDL